MEQQHINAVLQQSLIRYSQVWEDHRLLNQGLQIRPSDNVISIASAGCNALSMLLDGANSVVAVDMNPAQIALCKLKKSAIEVLDVEGYRALMGLGGDAAAVYATIRSSLESDVRGFWDDNLDLIRIGIVHTGKLDRYFRVFQTQFIAPHVPDDALRQFLNSASPVLQGSFFDGFFGNPTFVEMFKRYTGKEMIASSGRDPAQFTYVTQADTGSYFYERFRHVCVDVPAHDNFYLKYLLSGEFGDLEMGPPQYRTQDYDRLKERIGALEIRHERLDETLKHYPQGHFSKANLSDLFEYLSEDECRGLFELLTTKLSRGGRLAYWNLLVGRGGVELGVDGLASNSELANRLWVTDRCFFYSRFVLDDVL